MTQCSSLPSQSGGTISSQPSAARSRQTRVCVLGNLKGGAPEQLQVYVGAYQLAPKVELTVTREGDQLETQLTGQPKVPIYPETPTLFFLKIVDAQLEFAKDAAGKVTQVTLHQNGHDMVARKK